ncbi:MAG: aldo/keto reductase [Pseudomonadota bacterium]
MKTGGLNRREFILRTAVGLITAGLGLPSASTASRGQDKSPQIVYRTLGRTGLRIPLVSFGVMNSDSPDLIRKALDMGINHLDTAHRYLRGNSETVIGEILEEQRCRDKVLIATKMYFNRDKERKAFIIEGTGRHPGATEENLNSQLGISLKRLRTDHVDILYLHSCEGPLMPSYEPMMKAFVKVKESGKARFIGITTHTQEPETIRAAADAGIWDVVLTSYNFVQAHRGEVREAIRYAAEKGMGVVAMKTQGGVRLNREKNVQVNHAAALKWVLNDKNVCTAIPGMTAFEQMDLDFSVMGDLSLSDEEKRDLQISSMLSGMLYCQQCGSCVGTCPQRIQIPTLMRAYMYAEGYGNLLQAELTLDELPTELGLNACSDCTACRAVCPYGIDIGARLRGMMGMAFVNPRAA